MENYSKRDIVGIIFFALSILFLGYMFLTPLTHLIVHFDEYFTLTLIKSPVSDIMTITSGDVHPPLYYLIAKAFAEITKPLGLDLLFSLKIFSIIPYILILILSATKIRKEYGFLTAGLFALSLAVMSEFFTHFLRARMYGWAILFTILAFMAFMEVIKTQDKKHWVLLTIFSVLCAYTHYFAAISAGCIYLILLAYLIKFKKVELKIWFVSVVFAIVLYLPWVLTLMNQLTTIQHSYWIRGANLNTIVESLGYFAYSNNEFFTIISIIILVIILFIYSRESKQADERNRFLILSGIGVYVGTIILALIISVVYRPILVVRYLLPVAAVLWLGISIILDKIEDRRMFLIAFALIVLLLINGVAATLSTNDELCKNGVVQKEVFDNITQDSNAMLVVNSPNLVMYFLNYANQTDMYCVNAAKIFGENMTRLHQIYDFKSYRDIDGLIANNTDKNVYIISWNDPVLNSTTVTLDKQVNVVFSKVNHTNVTDNNVKVV